MVIDVTKRLCFVARKPCGCVVEIIDMDACEEWVVEAITEACNKGLTVSVMPVDEAHENHKRGCSSHAVTQSSER